MWFPKWFKNIRWSPGESKLRQKSSAEPPIDPDYQNWITHYDTIGSRDREEIRQHIHALDYQPLISILMPVYDSPEHAFREAIESVRAQLYSRWELCIADDASQSPQIGAILAEVSAGDPRVKWVRRRSNGHISEASNSALTLATGKFIALMDHDDLLPEQALYEVVVELNLHPEADIIYSDEDRIDSRGRRHSPYFKPDWNPELFLGQNLVSHLGVYRRSRVEELGGFRIGYEGSQDYDLALRVVEATSPDKIRHIPTVLYHWRSIDGSFSTEHLDRCLAAARLAKTDHLARMEPGAEVLANPYMPGWERVRRPVPKPAPLVSLIVLARDRRDLLARCLDGLLNRTNYQPLEIIAIHRSDGPSIAASLKRVSADARVRIMGYEGPANSSDMRNKAAAEANGEILGFVNHDVEVIDPDWLSEMVSLAVIPENGAIGAKLLYPNGRVQNGGVILGGGDIEHAHLNAGRGDLGYFGRLALTTNVSAVTGACLVLRKAVFEEVGGFDTGLSGAYSDVDLCLKMIARGYRNVFTPFALLYHHKPASRERHSTLRKLGCTRRELNYLQAKWGGALERDRYFNPNLALKHPFFTVAFPSHRSKPWRTQFATHP